MKLMEYSYYVQAYAKQRADSILPVPEDYPLRGAFGPQFIPDFSELTKILKAIYTDAAENPAAYQCDLYPLNMEARGAGVDNESNAGLDRIVKCMRTLCDCGEMMDNALKVNADAFNRQIKKVKKYTAVIEKLKDFGFVYQGDMFDKNAGHFFVTYPGRPHIIHALKTYMACWNDVLKDEYLKSEIKKNGYGCIAYYYGFYLFDYKVTANPKALDPLYSVKDACYTWDKESQNAYMRFYECSKQYPAIHFFDGGYYIGKKRISTFRYHDRQVFLKLKLKNPNDYISQIESLPGHLRACFSDKARKCRGCGCLGNKPDTCGNRIYWTLGGVDYIGCSMESFYFNGIKDEDMPGLFALLEHEYGIQKSAELS